MVLAMVCLQAVFGASTEFLFWIGTHCGPIGTQPPSLPAKPNYPTTRKSVDNELKDTKKSVIPFSLTCETTSKNNISELLLFAF